MENIWPDPAGIALDLLFVGSKTGYIRRFSCQSLPDHWLNYFQNDIQMNNQVKIMMHINIDIA